MKDYIIHDVDNNKFVIEGEGKDKGYASYTVDNGALNINSTFVDSHYRGKGYARDLVDADVEYAKSKDLKLAPTCSYAVKVIERYYADMLA